MIRTLAVLAGGFLGFAAALMVANSSSLEVRPPVAHDRVTWPERHEERTQASSEFETALSQYKSDAIQEDFNDAWLEPEPDAGPDENVLADTTRPNEPEAPPDRTSDLYRLQFELARLDCYDGPIDGRWSIAFHESLAQVALTAELDLVMLGTVTEIAGALRTADPVVCTTHDLVASAGPALPARQDKPAPEPSRMPQSVKPAADTAKATAAVALQPAATEIKNSSGVKLGGNSDLSAQTHDEISDGEPENIARVKPRSVLASTPLPVPATIERHGKLVPTSAEPEFALPGIPPIAVQQFPVPEPRAATRVSRPGEAEQTLGADKQPVIPLPKIASRPDGSPVRAPQHRAFETALTTPVTPDFSQPETKNSSERLMPVPVRNTATLRLVSVERPARANPTANSVTRRERLRATRRSRARASAAQARKLRRAAAANAAPSEKTGWKYDRDKIFATRR